MGMIHKRGNIWWVKRSRTLSWNDRFPPLSSSHSPTSWGSWRRMWPFVLSSTTTRATSAWSRDRCWSSWSGVPLNA